MIKSITEFYDTLKRIDSMQIETEQFIENEIRRRYTNSILFLDEGPFEIIQVTYICKIDDGKYELTFFGNQIIVDSSAGTLSVSEGVYRTQTFTLSYGDDCITLGGCCMSRCACRNMLIKYSNVSDDFISEFDKRTDVPLSK